METALPIFLGLMALAYICSPLWSGAAQMRRAIRHDGWHSLEQLELDRETGKIDQAEYEEIKATLPTVAPTLPPLEAIIMGARRQKRVETALEAEILVARERAKKSNLN
ncbi:hypothetical protein EON80_07615 [bacterium]|nr:MAG: hypothetical protein EON80_07615 [bacterium]